MDGIDTRNVVFFEVDKSADTAKKYGDAVFKCHGTSGLTIWKIAFSNYGPGSAIYNSKGEKRNDIKAVCKWKIVLPGPCKQCIKGSRDYKDIEKYRFNLHLHELGHVQNGSVTAEIINTFLNALPEFIPGQHVKSMNSACQDVIASIIKCGHKSDVDYDKQTDHGTSQGAQFIH